MELIVRISNWVGDVIMSLPALQALERQGFKLHLYGKKWLKDLLRDTPYQLTGLEKSIIKSAKILRRDSAQHMLLLTNSLSSALSGKLAGKNLIGYNTDGRSILLNHALKKPMSLHEVEYFWRLAAFCSENLMPEKPFTQHLPDCIELPINVKASKIEKPYWVLCCSATGKGEDGLPKVWPYWREFSAYLASNNIRHVTCPGPGEEEVCRKAVPHAEILPDLNLYEYLSVMKAADKVVANDSGPMHMASAAGVPMLGIFGNTDPQRTRPWGGDIVQGECFTWPTLASVIKVSSC